MSDAGGDGAAAGRADTAGAVCHEAVTVYRPNQRHELGLFETWRTMALNIWRCRGLIWQLFRRDFGAAYRKSFLGLTWIVLTPLMGIASWVFLKKTGLLQPGDTGIPYPAYVLVGSTMWGLFMGLYNSCSLTLLAGRDFVMQVNYPHEALLFKQAAERVADFLVSLALSLLVLLWCGVTPSWWALLLPLVALPMFLFAAAIGLIVSMFSVVAMDLSKLVTLGLGLLMYAVPVIYSGEAASPVLRQVTGWNPLTYLVCSCRDIVIYGRLYGPRGYFVCSGLALLLFLVSWRLFYVSEHKVVERMI